VGFIETRSLLAPGDRTQHANIAVELKERLISWLERLRSPHLEGVKQRKLA
jgi:hypothetical protein